MDEDGIAESKQEAKRPHGTEGNLTEIQSQSATRCTPLTSPQQDLVLVWLRGQPIGGFVHGTPDDSGNGLVFLAGNEREFPSSSTGTFSCDQTSPENSNPCFIEERLGNSAWKRTQLIFGVPDSLVPHDSLSGFWIDPVRISRIDVRSASTWC
jgi:hypothetical protein